MFIPLYYHHNKQCGVERIGPHATPAARLRPHALARAERVPAGRRQRVRIRRSAPLRRRVPPHDNLRHVPVARLARAAAPAAPEHDGQQQRLHPASARRRAEPLDARLGRHEPEELQERLDRQPDALVGGGGRPRRADEHDGHHDHQLQDGLQVRQRPRYRKFTDTVFKTCTTRSPIIGQVRCP